jgi:thymidine phosphorylase
MPRRLELFAFRESEELAREIAKLAGSPAHPAAGLRCLRKAGDVLRKNEPLFEVHAQSQAQLEMATDYATSALSQIVHFGF